MRESAKPLPQFSPIWVEHPWYNFANQLIKCTIINFIRLIKCVTERKTKYGVKMWNLCPQISTQTLGEPLVTPTSCLIFRSNGNIFEMYSNTSASLARLRIELPHHCTRQINMFRSQQERVSHCASTRRSKFLFNTYNSVVTPAVWISVLIPHQAYIMAPT